MANDTTELKEYICPCSIILNEGGSWGGGGSVSEDGSWSGGNGVNITLLEPANFNDLLEDSITYMVTTRNNTPIDLNVSLGMLKSYIIGKEIVSADKLQATDMISVYNSNLEVSSLTSLEDLGNYLNIGYYDLPLVVEDRIRIDSMDAQRNRGYITIGAIKEYIGTATNDEVLSILPQNTSNYFVRLNVQNPDNDKNQKFSLNDFRNWLFVSKQSTDIRENDLFMFKRGGAGEVQTIPFSRIEESIITIADLTGLGTDGILRDTVLFYGRDGTTRGSAYITEIYNYVFKKYDPMYQFKDPYVGDRMVNPTADVIFLVKDKGQYAHITLQSLKGRVLDDANYVSIKDDTLFRSTTGVTSWIDMKTSMTSHIFNFSTTTVQNDINDADIFLMYPSDDPQHAINGVSFLTIRDKIVASMGLPTGSSPNGAAGINVTKTLTLSDLESGSINLNNQNILISSGSSYSQVSIETLKQYFKNSFGL